MIQKKYLCKDLNEAENAIPQIKSVLKETKHKAALLTFYESGFDSRQMEALMEQIKDGEFPGLQIAGISITIVAELMPEGTGILLNLILTEDTDIEVVTLPCTPGEEDGAAEKLNSRLRELKNVKAVELFGSNMSLNITRFMERSMEGFEEAVLFGTTTTRGLFVDFSVEDNEQVFEIEEKEGTYEGKEFIYGSSTLGDGFVAVLFAGEKLDVQAKYALGWSPIGRRFTTELGEHPSKGETVVNRINDLPAVDIYREYLGVYPDAYLISNICEFPFIVERDGIDICLIPITCGEEGELFFMMTVHEGERLRLSFASHDEVLHASRHSLKSMELFQPEALFLTLCGNRINFLKEDAHLEWDGFKKSVGKNHALMHGACELYYHNKRGGILNSAHLAIGLKEKETSGVNAEYVHPEVESLRHGRTMPLSDRMSVFLRKITTELREAATEAVDANNAKSAFLSHMSHEIRTPINAILGMDEMILRESSEEEILEYAEDIRSAGNNLLGIVNDVLDFSKIEAGRMSIIPVEYEIASILNDLYNVVWTRAESKGLKVILDIEPTVPSLLFGDETRLKQVITNLLTNAVKYTEKGTVTLIIKKLEDSGNDREALALSCPGDQRPESTVRLSVSVKDTGIGIKPEDMEKLFVEYQRVEEKRNRKIEGTGLGLNITRELLELMGSRLNVESTYGEGSVFGFEIVQGVLKDDPVGEMNGRFRRSELRRYRVRFTAEDAHILVVDDTKVNLDVIKNLLKKTRINVDTAGSGEEALEMVRRFKYDVIFLDHLMPHMDGIETLKKMRELKDNLSEDAPVISLTANAVAGAKEEYIRAGFRDYLTKPVNPQELEDMLFNCIPPEKIRTVSETDAKKSLKGAAGLPPWLLGCSGIDVAEGLKNCGSKENYLTVLECFYEIANENADEIKDYYDKKDWKNYTVKVHALKSSSKLVGAMALSEEAAALEKAGHSGDTEVIERDTEALLKHYRALGEELSPIMG